MTPQEALDTLIWAADSGRSAIAAIDDWGPSGKRETQYNTDVAADSAIIEALVAEGFGILSEEAGRIHADRSLTAVLDPIDGSTNAALGLPWFATSICLVDAEGPWVSLVLDQASGQTCTAIRGGGAFIDGRPMQRRQAPLLSEAIVAISGLPPKSLGWAQFRAYGAVALDLTAVARGVFDGFVDCSPDAHGVWDYLGASLVCSELGIPVVDALGRDLMILDHDARRTPVCGADQALLEELLVARHDAFASSTNPQR
ncbi:MAG: inositol monophosphatase family protein [Acidimicrobiales bacterium]